MEIVDLNALAARTPTAAEALRAEVAARRQCLRALALQRVLRSCARAQTSWSRETLSTTCTELERQGDLLVAPGGVLHASPLRVIEAGSLRWKVVSSLPTATLAVIWPQLVDSTGISRVLVNTSRQSIHEGVEALRGVVLTPERWSRLDRNPAADAAWLESLERRLAFPCAPTSREEDLGGWSACVLTPGGARWRRSEPAGRLWRARSRWGHWTFAWTASTAPVAGSFVELNASEAARSVFALARVSATPIPCGLEYTAEDAIITVGEWLPVPEYRYLSVLGARDDAGRWRVPLNCIDEVISMLRERLGVSISAIFL